MKLNKGIQIILIACSILVLAACSHKRPNQSSINAANAAYGQGAESSGIGDESGYGEESQGGRRLSSSRVYYFDYDSYSVRGSDKPTIVKHANYLLAHSNAKIMVEGHTDPRGSREYNVGLGERRARAIAAVFTANGVKPSQLVLVSYGAEKRAASGRTESDYQMDRRVVLVYAKR